MAHPSTLRNATQLQIKAKFAGKWVHVEKVTLSEATLTQRQMSHAPLILTSNSKSSHVCIQPGVPEETRGPWEWAVERGISGST